MSSFKPDLSMTPKEIYLAGGCFWGLEKYMQEIPGVIFTQVGYANGKTKHPTYEEVCSHNTGHAETVYVKYDPQQISLNFLLRLYYDVIDPVSVNRQGNDAGSQYRTGIYYVDSRDLPIIRKSIDELQAKFDRPIAIEVKPLENYFKAEEYHQKYLDKNPHGYCHVSWEQINKVKDVVVDPNLYTPLTKSQLKQQFTELQLTVTQQNATEPPFNNPYWNHYEPGIYVDITSGEPLFSSSDKFDSGCGWPSFSKPIDAKVIREKEDTSYGMIRSEVRSRVGDAHLGHVFSDGPKELGGYRYCINSAALRFIPKDKMAEEGYGYLLPYVK
jgi:peptide methionine sulfoxide reductase msrA/msrB